MSRAELLPMMQGGIASYCDVIGIHAYGSQIAYDTYVKPWQWAAASGIQKPIAISEAGVTTGWTPSGYDPRQYQSDWLDSFYVMSKRFGYSYGLMFTYDEDHSADWAIMRNAGAAVQPAYGDIDTYLTNPHGLVNAGFETPNDRLHQWMIERNYDSSAWPSNFNWQYSGGHSGSYSARAQCNSGWDITAHQVIDGLTPGVPVTVSAWMKVQGTTTAKLVVNGYSATDGDASSATTTTSTAWQQVSVTVTPTNPWIVVSLGAGKAASTNYCFFDDITVTQAPAAPSGLAATATSSSQINLSWTDNSSNETGFKIERATNSGFTANLITTTVGAGVTSYASTGLTTGTTYYYRVRASNGSGDSSNSAVASATPVSVKLTGTVIGTPGSYNNSSSTIDKVFDGSLTTFFDAPTSSGAWVGLDLGSPKLISMLKFAPRPGGGAYPGRMVGGQFQVSNTADFSSGVVTIYTITTAPTTGVLTSVSVAPGASYRYIRYLSPSNGWCNISEMEVWS